MPPTWYRWLGVLVGLAPAVGIASKRGWAVGGLAAVLYGGLALLFALRPEGVRSWSRRHPTLDRAFLGPLVLFAVAYFTSLPLWLCVLIGVVGSGLGIALGGYLERRRAIRSA
ncbi:hypothetical protein GCM10027080_17560 [Pedococcus soli]